MNSQVKTTRFWFAWTFASLLVYPLAGVLVFALFMSLSFVVQVTTGGNPSLLVDGDESISLAYGIAIVSVLGGIVGLSVGMLQKWVVNRYFRIELHHWQRASAVGGLIAAPIMALALSGMSSYMSENYWQILENGQYAFFDTVSDILPMVIYVTVLSTVQLFILRQYVRNAWFWIMSNTVAGLMFSMLVAHAFDPEFHNWLLAAIAQGAVTGFAMLWLLHRLGQETEIKQEPEFAYQHVPIDTDDAADPPSVWDDAI